MVAFFNRQRTFFIIHTSHSTIFIYIPKQLVIWILTVSLANDGKACYYVNTINTQAMLTLQAQLL